MVKLVYKSEFACMDICGIFAVIFGIFVVNPWLFLIPSVIPGLFVMNIRNSNCFRTRVGDKVVMLPLVAPHHQAGC